MKSNDAKQLATKYLEERNVFSDKKNMDIVVESHAQFLQSMIDSGKVVEGEENKYESMIQVFEEAGKMNIPIRLSLNRWGEWHVFALGQKFKNKDVTIAAGEAIKLILKVKF